MERIKEFIEKEITQANFKLNYILELATKYDINADGLDKESINIETEIKAYTRVLDFINNLPIEKKREYAKNTDEEKVIYKDTNEIGWKCYVARHKLGETMQQFSKRFNVDTSAIGKWERGNAHPNRKHYKQIEEIFEMVRGV